MGDRKKASATLQKPTSAVLWDIFFYIEWWGLGHSECNRGKKVHFIMRYCTYYSEYKYCQKIKSAIDVYCQLNNKSRKESCFYKSAAIHCEIPHHCKLVWTCLQNIEISAGNTMTKKWNIFCYIITLISIINKIFKAHLKTDIRPIPYFWQFKGRQF